MQILELAERSVKKFSGEAWMQGHVSANVDRFDMFNKIKDWGSSKAAAAYLRSKIEQYAELTTLEIDSSAKKMRVVLHLKGETEPVELRVDRYELLQDGEIHSIVVSQAHCSREWLQLIAADHLVGKKIKLPGVVAKML